MALIFSVDYNHHNQEKIEGLVDLDELITFLKKKMI